MESINTFPSITEKANQYLDTKIKLLKYEGIDKASAVIADVITDLIIVVFGLVAFLFFSITLALFAGYLLNSNWAGFGCVTLFYILILTSAGLFRIIVQNILVRIFIKKIFKKR